MARRLGYVVICSDGFSLKPIFLTEESARKAAQRAASKRGNAGKSYWIEGAMGSDWQSRGLEIPNKNPAAVALGSLGGSSTSEAKKKSSRDNGKLGGRPRKNKKQ